MAAAKKSEYVPSRKDLDKLVASVSPRYSSDEPKSSQLQKLHDEYQAAEDAFKEFCRTNEEYRRLGKANERARARYSKLSGKEREMRQKECRDCYNAIKLYGPTPKVIAMVQKLINKYDPPKEITE